MRRSGRDAARRWSATAALLAVLLLLVGLSLHQTIALADGLLARPAASLSLRVQETDDRPPPDYAESDGSPSLPLPRVRVRRMGNEGHLVRPHLHRGEALLIPDERLGWTLAPRLEQRTGGILFRTNSRGLRADREYTDEPPPGVARLAAFGDELTLCDEVTQDDCWVPRLAWLLGRAEILNFGVPGYRPDQAWLRYQLEGRAFEPCGVLIGYTSGRAELAPRTVDLIAQEARNLTNGRDERALDGQHDAEPAETVVAFAHAVAADGARPVVVVFPDPDQVRASRAGLRPFADLAGALHGAGIAVIDLSDFLSREAQVRGLDELYEHGQLSAFGNARVARYLAGLLPPLVSGACQL